jgi:hypothetical protein
MSIKKYTVVISIDISLNRSEFPDNLNDNEVIDHELLASGPYFLGLADKVDVLSVKERKSKKRSKNKYRGTNSPVNSIS